MQKISNWNKKFHDGIAWVEEKWKGWRANNKPLYYFLLVLFWIVSTLAAAALLDEFTPAMHEGWFMKTALLFFGGAVFIFIFIFAVLKSNKRGFLFWYPWGIVLLLVLADLFLVGTLRNTSKQLSTSMIQTNSYYAGLLQSTNAFFANSNSFLLGKIYSYEQQITGTQKQLDDSKRDAEAQIISLKLDLQKTTGERDAALNRNSQLELLPSTAVNMFMSTTGAITELTATAKQLQASASQVPTKGQISDLDQKTSDIERLPDGRTKFGGVITGSPKVILDALTAGIQSLTNKDVSTALIYFQRAISAFEATTTSGVMIDTSKSLTPTGKSALYWYAGVSAQALGSNNVANEYAEKADKECSTPQTKLLLVTTLANQGLDSFAKGLFTNSFEFYQEAITNYESIVITNRNSNVINDTNILRLYGGATQVAFRIGKTNEAIRFGNIAAELFGKLTNHTNAP